MKRFALFLSFIMLGYILGWTGSVLRFGISPFAWHRGHREPMGPDRMFEGIGLNPDQTEAIRKIRSEERVGREKLFEQMDEARRNFEKVLDSSQDRTTLQAAFDQVMERKNAMEQAHFQFMMKIHELLTLEQIKMLGEKRPKGRPGGPHGDHGPRPPPED